jgi:hypothetical protein
MNFGPGGRLRYTTEACLRRMFWESAQLMGLCVNMRPRSSI